MNDGFHQMKATRSPSHATSRREQAGKGAYRIESLAKGLRILSLFSETRRALRLSEIASLAGVPVATAFRLVATLE